MASSNTKSLLSAAGFHVRTPQTPLQKEVYAQLTPYHVERATDELAAHMKTEIARWAELVKKSGATAS